MECICNVMRKSTRAVSNFYDKALAPSGLRITQYTVLRVLSSAKGMTVGELAEKLELDQTSATRSIATLESSGYIERVGHHDPRVKFLKVTEKGKATLKAANVCWQKAQEQMLKNISEADLSAALKALSLLSSASLTEKVE